MPLTPRKEAELALLKQGPLSAYDVFKRLDVTVPRQDITQDLESLEKLGYVTSKVVVGVRKKRIYSLTNIINPSIPLGVKNKCSI